jgi:uncharacterized protein YjbI with pentapeptide repeats
MNEREMLQPVVNWTRQDKKQLRKALVRGFASYTLLAMFCSEELGLSLSTVANEIQGLDLVAFNLIEQACAEGFIDQLYAAFCREREHLSFRLSCEAAQQVDEQKEQESQRTLVAFVLQGSLEDTPLNRAKIEAIEAQLRSLSGDASLQLIDVREGSIKIHLDISEEGLERLQELIASGELADIEGLPVLGVGTLIDGAAKQQCELVNVIRKGDFSGADLRGANLTGANLTGANLTGAYLTRANLTGANRLEQDWITKVLLTEADLKGAILKGAMMPDGSIHD